ncbi:MAG TPA: hypothetical protein VGF48_20680 [Thermoanaerobaculia bacterium]|jgi:outer membrane translocation and assembly module TamA
MINPTEIVRVVDQTAAFFEAKLTEEGRQARAARPNNDVTGREYDDLTSSLVYAAEEREEALRDFELLSAADALHALAAEIQAECDRRMEEAYRAALDAYYVAEELARDPAHAELIPHVAAMRAAHEAQYGRPIPPKALE